MTSARRSTRHRASQRGTVMLVALLVVTLVVTLAARMLFQQYRATQVATAERQSSQARWVLDGALEWSMLILREDARQNAAVDHLGEPWAVPLEESRLSTFLSADQGASDAGPEAFLSGRIMDAQSRFNLYTLAGPGGEIKPVSQAALQRLCVMLGLLAQLAEQLAQQVSAAKGPADAATQGAARPFMPPAASDRAQTETALRWLGLPPDLASRLSPHVTFFPGETTVNANTASREVLAALIEGGDLSMGDRLVQARQRKAFQSIADIQEVVGKDKAVNGSLVGVSSQHFEVHGRLRIDNTVIEQHALVERVGMAVQWLESHTVRLP